MSYVRLKHTLAEIALDAIAHPGSAPTPALLLAYARMSRRHPSVSSAALARAAGVAPVDAPRALLATGLFDGADAAGRIALSAPFRPFAPYLSRQAARVRVALRLLGSFHSLAVPVEIRRAAALFNAGLYFECHEYLEDIWRASAGPERAFYHGLVQAAAGLYHFEKGNVHGTQILLGKAIAKLEPYAPAYREVDVAALLTGLRGVLSRLNGASAAKVLDRTALPALSLVASARPRRGGVRASASPPVPGGTPVPGREAAGARQNVRRGRRPRR